MLAKTSFPAFRFDNHNRFLGSSSPELDDTSCSDQENDDDSTVKKRFEQQHFKSKEEQDVAVFMNIANRMDLQSLIFILQGHAKAMNLPAAAQQQAAAKISNKQHHRSKSKTPKKFCFAMNAKNNVRCVVHVVPSVKDYRDMWWTDDEMKQIRLAAIQDVKYYRKYRADFAQSVAILASSSRNDTLLTNATIEVHMKKMMDDSCARGLEVHIVDLLSDVRQATVQAVLTEQDECRACNDSDEITADCLRQQSLAYTVQSTTFAKKIAQCDQIEALKASLSSRWEAGC